MKITKTQLKQIIKEEIKSTRLLKEWAGDSIGEVARLAEKIFQANPEGFARLFFEADYGGKQYYYWTKYGEEVQDFVKGVGKILDAEMDETESAQQILSLYDDYPYLEKDLEDTFFEVETEGDLMGEFYNLLVGHRYAGEIPSDPSDLPPHAHMLGYFFGYLYTGAQQAAKQLRSKQADGDLEPEQTFPDDEQVNRAMMGRLSEIIKEELEAILEEDDLDEITSRTKALARMRGVPHMGSGPLPKPVSPETEEESAPQSDGDKRRREMEIKMGLPPGTIKSGEELKAAEKKRKAKAELKPQTKSPRAPAGLPKYGPGGTHETWH